MVRRPPDIFVPEEVRPLYLVALPQDTSPVYREALETFGRYREFSYRALLMQAELLYQDAWSARDRHIAALARLYQADLFARLGKRGRALSAARMSAKWLALQVPVEARYQEGVARYFAGVLAYLVNDARLAMRMLTLAANLLAEARRAWRFGGGHPQLAHCERLQRWIAGLLALRVEAWRQPNLIILPVYRWLEDDVVELDGATAVDRRRLLPEKARDEAEAIRRAWRAPSDDELPDSEMVYFAVKVPKGKKGVAPQSTASTAESLFYVETEPDDTLSTSERAERIPFEFITGEVHGKVIIGDEDKPS